MEIRLIRHFATEGNLEKRYIGVTDEEIKAEFVLEHTLKKEENGRYGKENGREEWKPELVIVSPLRRCRQTAEILFPGEPVHIIEELAECDFGEFENKNYKELEGNPHYQEWIDSNGTLPFPGGESREGFKSRNLRGFDRVVSGCIRSHVAEAALVIHGGTIMNVMEEYADEDRSFYDWHVQNGKGYEVEIDPELWKKGRKFLHVIREL